MGQILNVSHGFFGGIVICGNDGDTTATTTTTTTSATTITKVWNY